MMVKTDYASPLGTLTLASDGENLTGLWMAGQKYFAAGIPTNLPVSDDLPVFSKARDWLDRYFSGERPLPGELPLAPQGSTPPSVTGSTISSATTLPPRYFCTVMVSILFSTAGCRPVV